MIYPNDYVEQQYLPYELSGREFYQLGDGYEVKIREHMARIKKEAAEASSKNKRIIKSRYLIAGLEQLRNQVFVYFLIFFCQLSQIAAAVSSTGTDKVMSTRLIPRSFATR